MGKRLGVLGIIVLGITTVVGPLACHDGEAGKAEQQRAVSKPEPTSVRQVNANPESQSARPPENSVPLANPIPRATPDPTRGILSAATGQETTGRKCDNGVELTCPQCEEGQICLCNCKVGGCWCK